MREASRIVGLPRDTRTGWRARKEATGEVQARGGSQRGHSHKITDPEQFKAFVQDPGEATGEELAAAGGGVKGMRSWRQLRKLGSTHQKRPAALLSATKP